MSTRATRPAGDSEVVAIAFRVVIDGTRCDGHGICVLRLPERISLDEWGYAVVDEEPLTRRRSLVRARRAVNACPAHALELVTCADRPAKVASRDPRPRVVG
jgi:ferredoxin